MKTKRNAFFSPRTQVRRRIAGTSSTSKNKSRFETCPLCNRCFPLHLIEMHASTCDGQGQVQVQVEKQKEEVRKGSVTKWGSTTRTHTSTASSSDTSTTSAYVHAHAHATSFSAANRDHHPHAVKNKRREDEDIKAQWSTIIKSKKEEHKNKDEDMHLHNMHMHMPVPGLYVFEEFISMEEEEEIIRQLDGDGGYDEDGDGKEKNNHHGQFLPWVPSRFNGKHVGKRWGVHCSLKDRKVYPEENPLPTSIQKIIDRISCSNEMTMTMATTTNQNGNFLANVVMKGCKPNEANAIDYRRSKGDYLRSHVDDRQLSKEPIANLSLAGDCYMIYKKERRRRRPPFDDDDDERKVLLKRRTLQVLTGSARYDYSHGLRNEDLLSDRRISITMRESPLSSK